MQIFVVVRLTLIHMAKLKFLVCAEAVDNSLQWKFIKKCGMKISMVFNVPGQFVQSETERLNSLNLSFGKLKLLSSNFCTSQNGDKNAKNLPFSSTRFLCKWSTAALINLANWDSFIGKLSDVHFKTSSWEFYLSLVSFSSSEKVYSSFLCFKNLLLIL